METMRQDCDILSTRQTETARECVDACILFTKFRSCASQNLIRF